MSTTPEILVETTTTSTLSTTPITTTPTILPTTTTTTPRLGGSDLPEGAVVGAVIGGIAGFVIVLVLVTLLVWKFKRTKNRRPPPELPHPNDIGRVYVSESPAPTVDSANGVDTDEIYVDPGEEADKSKTNISFVDSDNGDLPEPNNDLLNNNKPNNSTQGYTPHNNTAHNNTTPHKISLHPPIKPLVPKSSSESVINRYGDHAASPSRPRAGSLKPAIEEDYIQMSGGGKSPISSRTLPPPSTCKPKPGHGYINLPNEDKHNIPKSPEPDPTRNSDVYENFSSSPESTFSRIDKDQGSEKAKTPKYINVEKIASHLPTAADGNLSEEEQESYINMENLSVSPPPSDSVSEKLNGPLGATGHSLGRPSRPNTPSKGTPPNATDPALHQVATPKTNELTSNKGRSNGAPKPMLDQSKGKSLDHQGENEKGVGVSVLFKNAKSVPDLPLVVGKSGIPTKAKTSPGVKLNISRANEQQEQQMESDSNTDNQNSDHDSLYENSAEFYRSQGIEDTGDSSGQKAIDKFKADQLVTQAANIPTKTHENQIELDSNADTQNSDHDSLYENSAEFYRPQVIENISDGSGKRPNDKQNVDRLGTPGTKVSDNSIAQHPKTQSPNAKNARKPPAVLPKSVVKNNTGTPDIAELKARLKKTNFVYNVSGEHQQTN